MRTLQQVEQSLRAAVQCDREPGADEAAKDAAATAALLDVVLFGLERLDSIARSLSRLEAGR